MLWSLRNKLVLTYLLIRAGSGGAVRDAGDDLCLCCGGTVCDPPGGLAAAGGVERDGERECGACAGDVTVSGDAWVCDAAATASGTGSADGGRGYAEQPVAAGDDEYSSTAFRWIRGWEFAGRTPFGLPPWAAELPGSEFQGVVLDGNEIYLVAVHQRRLSRWTCLQHGEQHARELGGNGHDCGWAGTGTRMLPSKTGSEIRAQHRAELRQVE